MNRTKLGSGRLIVLALTALVVPLMALVGPANADEPEVIVVVMTGANHFHQNDKRFWKGGNDLPPGIDFAGEITCETVNGGVPITANLPGGQYTIDMETCSGLSLVGPGSENYVIQLVQDYPYTVYRADLAATTSSTGTVSSLLAGKMTFTTKVVEWNTTTPVAGIKVDITYNPTVTTAYKIECSAITDANGIAKCSVPPTKMAIFGFTYYAKGPGSQSYNPPYAQAKVPFA